MHKLDPQSLRRTFASVLYALGEAPPIVMQEMGHTSPALALRVYAQAMRRGEGEQAQLRALVEGAESELFVRAGHACLEEREVIRETARILAEHIRRSGMDSSHLLGVAEPRGESWDLGRSGSGMPATEGTP